MSPRMLACPRCANHVLVSSNECPHCGAVVSGGGGRLLKTAGAAMLGLTLSAGCDQPQPDYGIPDTGDTGEAQPDYGVPDTGETGIGEDTGPSDLYGVPDTGMYTDQDGDGYTEADGDCDDSDASIHPGAQETPGDGVDSNCDGNDDT
ncbi:MAG: putative metal-binding motif-containing protein [Myxococcota bacterium]|nr:putative metal-binding motif-containing protein [Myxococcota bacterium]